MNDDDFSRRARAHWKNEKAKEVAKDRDMFAANALAGIIASDSAEYGLEKEEMARSAYQFADAMLEARRYEK